VGVIGRVARTREAAFLRDVTVDPDFRGRGIARGMLTAGIAPLRARGAFQSATGAPGRFQR